MPAYAAPIELVQAALHRVAEEAIVSLDEGSANSLVVSSNYEGIIRAYFARHAWSFATDTVDLTLEEEISKGPWTHQFVLPPEVINIRWVLNSSGQKLRTNEYTVQRRKVLTRADDTLQAVVTLRVPEAEWPPDFSEAAVVRMQGLFLESICEKPQDGRLKIKDAEAMLQAAIVRDKRQSPSADGRTINSLADTWRGRS